MIQITLFWRNGKSQIAIGHSIASALYDAGYNESTKDLLAFWALDDKRSDYCYTDGKWWHVDKLKARG